MKSTDKFNFMIGFFMMIVGFIGLVWKSIEVVIFRFQNPDYTEYRVMMERPELIIYGAVFALICYGGYYMATHYANKY